MPIREFYTLFCLSCRKQFFSREGEWCFCSQGSLQVAALSSGWAVSGLHQRADGVDTCPSCFLVVKRAAEVPLLVPTQATTCALSS
jgi:hypothetical protein